MKRFLKVTLILLCISAVIVFFIFGSKSYRNENVVLSKNAAVDVPQPEHLKALRYVQGEDSNDSVNEVPASPRKIIQTGQIALSVKHYDRFYQSLQNQLQQSGGFISNLEANRNSGEVSFATIVIRIPPAQTNFVVSWLREQGQIQSENIKADDVSQEYYDLEARLTNAKKMEVRLLDMLSKNTGKLQDLILIEEKLGEVRERIEQMETQIRNMDRLIALATFTLQIQVESSTTISSPTFSSRAANAWNDSVVALKEASQGFVLILITIVPWIIPFILVALILVYIFRFVRNRFTAETRV